MDRSCTQGSQDRPQPRGSVVLELALGAPRGFEVGLAVVPVTRLKELLWWGKRGAKEGTGRLPPSAERSKVPSGFSISMGHRDT